MKKRKQIRLVEYDYKKTGYYFITICIGTAVTVSNIVKGEVKLKPAGKIINKCWLELPQHYKNCKLDYYVIMPDHFHGIIIIDNDKGKDFSVGEGLRPSPTTTTKTTVKQHGLPEMIRAFKSFSSRKINEQKLFNERFHWQRSFYDRIIRNEKELFNIRQYIKDNPLTSELESNRNAHIF